MSEYNGVYYIIRRYLHTGEVKGTTPRLATIRASAIVARGADKALPTTNLRSRVMPKVDRSRIAESTKDGSLCKVALFAKNEGDSFIIDRDVSDLDCGVFDDTSRGDGRAP